MSAFNPLPKASATIDFNGAACRSLYNRLLRLAPRLFACLLIVSAATASAASPSAAKPLLKRAESTKPDTSLPAGPYRRAEFLARGSHCLTCLRSLERELRQTRGVLRVRVSLHPAGQTVVIYKPDVGSWSRIKAALKKENYKIETLKQSTISHLPEEALPAANERHERVTGRIGDLPELMDIK